MIGKLHWWHNSIWTNEGDWQRAAITFVAHAYDGLGSQPDASKEISGELLLGYNRMMADGAPAGGGCGERTNG